MQLSKPMIQKTNLKLKVQYLENYNPNWPKLSWKHEGDSGLDLRACIESPLVLPPQKRIIIPNGIKLELEGDSYDFEIQIRARSGLALSHGITCANSIGTVDFNYRGEIKTILINLGEEDFHIEPGDRISQAVICPVLHPYIEEVNTLTVTTRDASGFGSTGKR